MTAHPIQSILGAALLLSLAFTVNDHVSAPPAHRSQLETQLACDEAVLSKIGAFQPAGTAQFCDPGVFTPRIGEEVAISPGTGTGITHYHQ